MTHAKLEYIWLDGYQPEPNLRSKTKVWRHPGDTVPAVEDLPLWGFDGSSTLQAEGKSSDLQLKPVRVIADPGRINAFLVMCEVLNPDLTPHPTNTRACAEDDPDFWFGFEQEFVLMKNGRPLGFPEQGYPGPQGPYYCAVGDGVVDGREIVEEHLDLCLEAGLEVTGINAEVLLGQWEFQLFGKGLQAADDLWLARYLLLRVAEEYRVKVSFHPKPIQGDWNGSGMHANFSNTAIREQGGEEFIKALCEKFRVVHDEHIAVYGSDNHLRLTGLHETQSIDKFTYGPSDRGSSIRIPMTTIEAGWKGHLEDRRPASNADPYKVIHRIIRTVKE